MVNTAAVYLIVTMGSAFGLANQGYGGVSVTPVEGMEECQWLKKTVEAQIRDTDFLHFDDNEILVRCEAK